MQNKKATVYLIAGFIGAGKTTFSKKLETETGALRFTKDEWMIVLFGRNAPQVENFVKFDSFFVNFATELALKCATHGVDVIIDDGFWFKKQRDDVTKRIASIGANVKGYYLKCPKDILEQRVLGRSKQLSDDSFDIDKEMFTNYYESFEEPSPDENFELIKNY
ncbi:MAG: ATP-binding protein [bacterium]